MCDSEYILHQNLGNYYIERFCIVKSQACSWGKHSSYLSTQESASEREKQAFQHSVVIYL
jgi:hypothetical protein